MDSKCNYWLMAFIVVLGILACTGWVYIGQDDDAPGAGMIGLVALAASLIVSHRLWRRAP